MCYRLPSFFEIQRQRYDKFSSSSNNPLPFFRSLTQNAQSVQKNTRKKHKKASPKQGRSGGV